MSCSNATCPRPELLVLESITLLKDVPVVSVSLEAVMLVCPLINDLVQFETELGSWMIMTVNGKFEPEPPN